MTTRTFLDFETHSTLDLKEVGVYVYALHRTTDIICMAHAMDDDDVCLWTPGQPYPLSLSASHVNPYDHPEFWAHNANFERIIWQEIAVKRYGFPELQLEDWYCSAAQCSAMGFPRNLEHAAIALDLGIGKDKPGHALMMQLAKPRSVAEDGTPAWWDAPDKLERLYEYCKQDVRVERDIAKVTRRLDRAERDVYLLDQDMNDEGIRVDIPLIKAARKIALEGIIRANKVIAFHTDGNVEKVTQVARMQKWLEEQGCSMESLAKASVSDALKNGNLTYAAEQVLIARSEAGKSSVAKLNRMLDGLVEDRIPGLLMYHGAHTGRWAGRRVQPHNFPRPTVKDPEQYIDLVMAGEYDKLDLLDNPVDIIASLLRSMIIGSPELYVGDYSFIEAIVLAWLAGQDDLVARFASGENVYLVEGETVGATRQHGKAILLGCGFGMGAPRFVENAKQVFGIDITLNQAQQFVRGYRERYSKIPDFWYALQAAFLTALETPNVPLMVGRLRIISKGRYIWVTLPSGRPLCYIKPRIIDRQLSVMRTSFGGRMERRDIWGGVLAENVTQAVARDVMVSGMLRLDDHDYYPVLTVHDEIICEQQCPGQTLEEFLTLMSEAPAWASGLPVLADGFLAERYRKG